MVRARRIGPPLVWLWWGEIEGQELPHTQVAPAPARRRGRAPEPLQHDAALLWTHLQPCRTPAARPPSLRCCCPPRGRARASQHQQPLQGLSSLHARGRGAAGSPGQGGSSKHNGAPLRAGGPLLRPARVRVLLGPVVSAVSCVGAAVWLAAHA